MRHKNKLIFLLLIWVASLYPQSQIEGQYSLESFSSSKTTKDELSQDDSTTRDTTFFKNILLESRSTAKKVIAWPFENVIQPVLSMMIYPIKPPLRYVFKEEVIDRGIDFVSLGEDNNIMIYPTFTIGSGAESSLGLSYIHRNLFFDSSDKSKIEAYRTIDDDWFYNGSHEKQKIKGLPWSAQISMQRRMMQNISLYNQNNSIDTTWLRSDSTFQIALNQSWRIDKKQSLRLGLKRVAHQYRTDDLLKAKSENILALPLAEQEAAGHRNSMIVQLQNQGYWDNFTSYPISIGYTYNSKESKFASTYGNKASVNFIHAPVMQGFGDYQVLEFSYTDYFLLGERAYKLDSKEDKKQKKYLRDFGISDALEFLDAKQWEEIFLQRKVLVNYISYRQAWDGEKDQVAIYESLSTVGKMTPLRGYPSGRFVDYGSLNWSAEYRWPLIRMVDGIFFNEYAWSFRGPHTINLFNYKNSFGFGFRIRKPSLYLMRLNLGFHGPIFATNSIEGFVIQLTIRPEF